MYVFAAPCVGGSVLHRQRRLSTLLSVQPIFTRLANTSSNNPFPFPSHRNPTAHEIFHLPRDASQDEIKTRYYELVRVYHPDVTPSHCQVPPSVRNFRFRAITYAYDSLRGRHALNSNGAAGSWDYHRSRDETIRAELRRRSRRHPSSATTSVDVGNEDTGDAQAFYALVALVFVGTIVAMGSVGSHMDRVRRHTQSAAANLAQARSEAQLYGMERRRKIREHVKSFHDARDLTNGSKHAKIDHSSKV